MRSSSGIFAAAAFVAAAAAATAEDLTISSRVTYRNSETTSTHWITSEWSRSSTRDSTSIVHFTDGRVTFLDDRRQEYWELTADDMEDYWDDMARRLRTSGAGDVWDLRAKPNLEKLSGRQKIAGYDCEHWSLDIADDALELDFWVAPSLQPPAGYYDGRRILAITTGPMAVLFEKAFEELKKVKGYPLSMTTIVRTPMSRTEVTEEATEVRKGTIPASNFQVPSGYKKVKPPSEK
jgi:hypothetical protein